MSGQDCILATGYEGGVLAIDSGLARERMAACYLLEDEGSAAFVETGTNASTPRLLRVLHRRGWRPEDVRWVIVTHVHLDHAGGAGSLMQALPEAQLLVHPRGARHMIDPGKLEASVRQVYGDEVYDATYGELVPIAADRVREMTDGESVNLGTRTLTFRDTPGHARHHFCVWDDRTRGWFTGDTFGVSYREFDTDKGPFVFPTTTPIQFEPEALSASVAMLLEPQPRWMYLTHFGRVAASRHLADQMLNGIGEFVSIGERFRDSDTRTRDIQDGMREWLVERLRRHGVALSECRVAELLEMDVVLNTQGIEFWLDNA